MSEETTNTAYDAAATERVGYCQDCGKPLTRETVRAVGSGVFCEPCLATRLGTASGYGAAPGVPPYGAQPGQPAGPQPGPTPPGWNPVGAGAQGAGGQGSGGQGSGGSGSGGSGSGGSGSQGSGGPGFNAGPPFGFTPAPSSHLPNPTLAGLLGIIPGVGAMYNGQFVKGLLHFAVFGVLVILSNNVSGVFGLFIACWVIYQIFDAYHTARARRDGTALPNLFGINELADRIGSGQGWSTVQPPVAGPQGQPTGAAPPPPPVSPNWGVPPAPNAAPYSPVSPPVPPAQGAANYGTYAPPTNWAGYTHPTTFAVPSPPPPAYPPYPGAPADPRTAAEQIRQQAYRDAGFTPPAYQETFAGTEVPAVSAVPATRRFPVGAIWLIGFGVLVLLGNLSSEWHISGLWTLSGLFAALAIWTLIRRLEWAGGYTAVVDGNWPRLACMLRAPIMLLTLSVLFLLQAAHVATFGQTWPVLPISLGFAVLLERTVGVGQAIVVPPASSFYAAGGPVPVVPVAPAAPVEEPHPSDVQR